MTNLFFTLILAFSCITGALASEADHGHEMSNAQVWAFGMLTGAGLASVGFVAALIVVCLRKLIQEKTFKILVNMLYALGCGAMVGDVMIHILPASYKSQEVNFRFVALIFIAAIVAFLGIQRLFVSCGVAHQHWGEEDHDHKHQHQHQNKNDENQRSAEINLQSNGNNGLQSNSPKKSDQKSKQAVELKLMNSNKVLPIVDINDLKKQSSNFVQIKADSNTQLQNEVQTKTGEDEGCCSSFRGKGSAGYLNLLSSFIHNFLDGFAIGAAFASKNRDTFVPVIIAVYAHEIPREMGDVGILLKNKFNAMQTILCNGVINLISLIGVVIGIALGSLNASVQIYLLTFVAGNFIYIGADIWRNLLKNKTVLANILQFLSFSLGVGSMYLVLLAQSGQGGQHQH